MQGSERLKTTIYTESHMSFENLNLIEPIRKALATEGYTVPTPIQSQAIPVVLEGRDLLGSAQTGTGKTAAFAIPILQLLYSSREPVPREEKGKKGKRNRKIRALIVTPTRELAVQVRDSFRTYGIHTGLKTTVVYGGVSQVHQVNKLRKGVDILVATPGRLLDLVNQKHIKLSDINLLVLDEADMMLDMGFIHDIRKIINLVPSERQTLFFSATMPAEIVKLSNTILRSPVKIAIAPEIKTAEVIRQAVYFVARPDKKNLLLHILREQNVESALVFTRTKRGADAVTKHLVKAKIQADAIHGNKTQGARQRALNNFKSKQTRVLVATDIAARGLDIEKLSHVFNYDIPEFSEAYIHRIGRTGRAGVEGTALSFCDSEERSYLRQINRMIKSNIPIIEDHPFKSVETDEVDFKKPAKKFKPSKKKKEFRFSNNSKKKSSGKTRGGKNKRFSKKKSFKTK